MQLPLVGKLHPVFWLVIVLAAVTASCMTIPPGSRSVNLGRSGPVKGGSQLMDHPR
jgi:hypothetical protein